MADSCDLAASCSPTGPVLILQDYLRHGGSESHTVWLASSLRRAGVDVRVLTFRSGGSLVARLVSADVPHLSVQPFDFRLDWFAPGLVGKVAKIAPSRVLLMGKLANASAPLLRRYFPTLDITGSVRTGSALPWYVRRALPHPNRFVCNCEAVADSLAVYGIGRARITVIPNPPVTPPLAPDDGIRARVRAEYGASDADCVALSVAGFRPGKGHADLIRTLAASSTNLVLWLAGDGVERAGCEALARELGVANRIRFLGHVADPRPLYLAADCATMASSTDAMSNFLVESALHGLPIVAWDFAGTRETFTHDESGLLAPYGDHATLAAYVSRVSDDPVTRRRFSDTARTRAPGLFSEAAALAAYRAIFGLS